MEHELPTLSLLGPFAVRSDNRRQKLPFAGQTRRVFIYLAGHANCGLRRDVILDELWPITSPNKAASALNTTIWRIKQGLSCFPGFSIETVDDIIRLSVESPASVDTQVLANVVSEASRSSISTRLPEDLYQRLLRVVKNCRGPFLDGCSDHWILPLREEFCTLHIRALTLLMRDRAAWGDYDRALDHGRSILALDPFREGTQREIMWLYAFNGQRAQAIRQYLQLRILLGAELGLDPMPETKALYAKISNAQDSIEHLARKGDADDKSRPGVVPAVCLQSWGELAVD